MQKLIERGHFDTMGEDFVRAKATELAAHLQALLHKHVARGGVGGQLVHRGEPNKRQVFWVAPQFPGEKEFPGVVWEIDAGGVLCQDGTVRDEG